MVNEQREAFLANRVLIEAELAEMARRRGRLIEAKMHERESERYLKELAEYRRFLNDNRGTTE